MIQYSIISIDETFSKFQSLSLFHEYLNHLFSNQPAPSVIDTFATGYHDYLQTPLQPLMDNLQSATYEVFESDPVKYSLYEEAIFSSLLTRTSINPVIMVVGAGRGPLVDRSITAARRAGKTAKIYVIEKNSNAIITLRLRKKNEWKELVHEVIHTDMRSWNCPEKCDILVSELLGSFGDNELSPECLDGAQRLLKGLIIFF
jgi:protein arginine N-methyltransferase 5